MIILSALANSNIPKLRSKYETFVRNCSFKNSLNAFESHLKSNLSISINIRINSLLLFLQDGYYKNSYQLFHNDYDQLENANPLFYYRLSFDTTFKNGTTFIYAALNTGNIGTVFWGDFCVHLKNREDNPVIIKYNSLQKESNGKYRYFSQEKELLLEKLENELANYENSIPLLVLKNKEKNFNDTVAFDSYVNTGEDYVEVIIESQITADGISKIVLQDKFFDRILDKNVEHNDNRHEQVLYTKALKAIHDKKIKLEFI